MVEIPPEYKIYNLKDYILFSLDKLDLSDKNMLETKAKKGFFKQIVNRKQIKPEFKYVAAASLPAAAGTYDLTNVETPNWKDWLKPPLGQFYTLVLGFLADRYVEWMMKLAGSEYGWIESRTDADAKYTSDDHPMIVTINDIPPGEIQPVFKLYNYSKYTLLFAQAHIEYGHKYSIVNIDFVPDHYDVIILRDV